MATKETTDPALWTVRPAFGVAGGPDEIILTAEGRARAFSVGAQVKSGAPAEALEALALAGGSDALSVVDGSRGRLTDLGRRFDMVAWGRLKVLGYVDAMPPDGVRLTERGRLAVARAEEERAYLLARCRRAATPDATHGGGGR